MHAQRSAALLLLLALAATACAEPQGQGSAPAATSAAPAAPPPAPAPAPTAAPAVAAPDDLDLAATQKALKCLPDAKSGPCAVLASFATCSPWSAVVPSGDGRWIGHGYVVEGGNKTIEEITILRSKRVPTNEIGPGQLPVRIGITDIAKEEGQAHDQADKLIRALARGDVAARSNAALEHVKKRETWPEGFAMKTRGGQVYVASQGGGFICQGPKQQLLLAQRAATRGSPGDGLYAELWPVTW
jgi:hypothetical protein